MLSAAVLLWIGYRAVVEREQAARSWPPGAPAKGPGC
jgi:hypothetical protein